MTDSFSPGSELLCFLFGFLTVFAGDVLFGRCRSVKNAAPFVRFLLATAFSYTAAVIRELLMFGIDFFAGTAFQGYDKLPPENLFFFSLFGKGICNDGQQYVIYQNIGFFYILAGCAVGGGILWGARCLYRRKKAEKA